MFSVPDQSVFTKFHDWDMAYLPDKGDQFIGFEVAGTVKARRFDLHMNKITLLLESVCAVPDGDFYETLKKSGWKHVPVKN